MELTTLSIVQVGLIVLAIIAGGLAIAKYFSNIQKKEQWRAFPPVVDKNDRNTFNFPDGRVQKLLDKYEEKLVKDHLSDVNRFGRWKVTFEHGLTKIFVCTLSGAMAGAKNSEYRAITYREL